MNFCNEKNMVFLAPMAGVSDRAFREICKSYGASYTVTEMVSSKALTMSDKKTSELLCVSDSERPTSIQLFGDDPEIMARAAQIALKYSPDAIDINMGCPAPKIASNGGGSSLMKNPELAASITQAVVNAVSIPVTVKMRTGWDSESINAPLMAKMLENAGASAICVHGRTKEQKYAPGIDYETIRKVKEAVRIPVIGNGDIKSGEDAEKMIKLTSCDAIMVGRGALGKPWIFTEINMYLKDKSKFVQPTIKERIDVLRHHIEKLCEYKGDYIGMREARKHSAWYIKGVRGAAQFRNEIGKLKTLDDLYVLCDKVSQIDESSDCDDGEFDKFCFNNL